MSTEIELTDLTSLQGHLAAQGQQVLTSPRGIYVRGEHTVEVVWLKEQGLINFRIGLPLSVPEKKRGQMALAVCAVNARIGVGSFQLRTGMTFEVVQFLDAHGAISSQVVEKCIEVCMATVRMYGAELQSQLSS